MNSNKIEIPAEVPAMTLPEAVLFPQGIMPLYIFEDRYQEMLRNVLAGTKLFAVGQLDQKPGVGELFEEEPMHPMATVGIIRACHRNPDGTSNLVLQGVRRVRVEDIVQEEPYRVIKVSQIDSAPGAAPEVLRSEMGKLGHIIDGLEKLGAEFPEGLMDFIQQVDEPDAYVDIAAQVVVGDAKLKQRLLETLVTSERYEQVIDHLSLQLAHLKLDKKLRGDLNDDDIRLN